MFKHGCIVWLEINTMRLIDWHFAFISNGTVKSTVYQRNRIIIDKG